MFLLFKKYLHFKHKFKKKYKKKVTHLKYRFKNNSTQQLTFYTRVL